MIQLKNLTEEQLKFIINEITDSFFDYQYSDEDRGLVKYISTRESMYIYMQAIITAAYKNKMLYATSENQEGYLFLSGQGMGKIKFHDGLKMISAEKKALGSFKNMKNFIKDCFCEGGTIETRMKRSKKEFIRIEMLVVRKSFQKQGFMKKMLDEVYEIAARKKVAVILDTDDKNKAARYEHLGMKLDKVRKCGEKFHMYDLIKN